MSDLRPKGKIYPWERSQTMREWLEQAQAARRKAVEEQTKDPQFFTKHWDEICRAADEWNSIPFAASNLTYGQQCADTDGLTLNNVAQGALYGMDALNRLDRDEALSRMNALSKETLHRLAADREIAQIRADYELAKSVLVAERDKLLAQCVKLTRERNEALEQLSARHGTQGEPAAGEPFTPDETPRANPFAHSWATSWRMR